VKYSFLILMFFGSTVMAAIKTETINYKAGDTNLKGFLAYDDSTTAKRPAIIVAPEWWGLTDYPQHRAQQLAELGYVAFAIDMYGDGKTTDDAKEAGAWSGDIHKNPQIATQRAGAALQALKNQPMVDADKIAAIGYCFGGWVALNMAREHMPILGVVSFHGDLSNPHPEKTNDVKAKILVLTGEADAFVPPKQVQAFTDEMKTAGADFKIISFPGAHHAFTNPDADRHNIDNIKYDPAADKQSWLEMKDFLANLLK
jgi:dienelactone hydrolase